MSCAWRRLRRRRCAYASAPACERPGEAECRSRSSRSRRALRDDSARPSGVADGRQHADLDAEVQVAHDAADHDRLLRVLLAEVRARGADDVEELQAHGRDAAEVAGARVALGTGVLDVDPRARSRRGRSPRALGAKRMSTPHSSAMRGVAPLRRAGTRRDRRLAELRRVDEERRDDELVLARAAAEERSGGRRGARPSSARARPRRRARRAARRSSGRSSCRERQRRAGERLVEMVELRPRVVDRGAVRARPSPSRRARSGPSARSRSRSCARISGSSASGGAPARLEEERRGALERDDVVRREDRAGVVERARRVGELERPQAEHLGEPRSVPRAPRPSRRSPPPRRRRAARRRASA